MMSRFETCLTGFTWRIENDGQPGHLDPNDPGGLTSWGMTYRTYCGWLKNTNQPIISQKQFVALPRTAFYPTYTNEFWIAVMADHLPIGLDLMVFDFAIVGGTHGSVAALQRCLNISHDGVLGPVTEHAILQNAAQISFDEFHSYQVADYKTRAGYDYWGGGWVRRANDALKQAKLDQIPISSVPAV
jgi:lysozyme family protein